MIIHCKKIITSNLILYLILRQLGANPKLQKYDGNKTVDIAIEEAKIHIEVDGVHHNKNPYQALSDLKRTYYDLQKGITTIRIPNSLVLDNPFDCGRYLMKIIKEQRNIDNSNY